MHSRFGNFGQMDVLGYFGFLMTMTTELLSAHTDLSPEENMTTDQKLIEHKSGGGGIMPLPAVPQPLQIENNLGRHRKLEKFRKTRPYHIEYAKSGFSDALWQAMEQRNVSQSKFAKRADVSKQYLTKIFRGENCTIETMVRLAFALKYKVDIRLIPFESDHAFTACFPTQFPDFRNTYVNLFGDTGYSDIFKPIVIDIDCEPAALIS